MVVWYAAQAVYPNKRGYAILGDDIVISEVAREYSKLMEKCMGVISKQNLYHRCCEFAKRFIIYIGMTEWM